MRKGYSDMQSPEARVVKRVCDYIEQHESIPTLDELGAEVHLSPQYLQRLFKRIMGISPRQYAEQNRKERLKTQLHHGQEVTHALYEVGFGSTSRLYEQANETLGMTPATYKNGAKGVVIVYAITKMALGKMLMARTDKGICAVNFADDDAVLEEGLSHEFSKAILQRDDEDENLQLWASLLLEHIEDKTAHKILECLPLDIQGTAFQARVWGILRTIPQGETRTYGQVAQMIGQPTATRAVARAIATNKIGVLIPCHRVIGQDGTLTGYRWGIERKHQLLVQEGGTKSLFPQG